MEDNYFNNPLVTLGLHMMANSGASATPFGFGARLGKAGLGAIADINALAQAKARQGLIQQQADMQKHQLEISERRAGIDQAQLDYNVNKEAAVQQAKQAQTQEIETARKQALAQVQDAAAGLGQPPNSFRQGLMQIVNAPDIAGINKGVATMFPAESQSPLRMVTIGDQNDPTKRRVVAVDAQGNVVKNVGGAMAPQSSPSQMSLTMNPDGTLSFSQGPASSGSSQIGGQPVKLATDYVVNPDNHTEAMPVPGSAAARMPMEAAAKMASTQMGLQEVKNVRNAIVNPDGSINRGLIYQMVDLPGLEPGLPWSKGRDLISQLSDAMHAKLRNETGASAKNEEVQSMMERFKPSVGDSDALVKSKLRRLQTVFELTIGNVKGTAEERMKMIVDKIKAVPDASENDEENSGTPGKANTASGGIVRWEDRPYAPDEINKMLGIGK